MLDNKCVPLKPVGHTHTIHLNNFLRAEINSEQFEAAIVGGRYQGTPPIWTERESWGRGPLSVGDTTHTVIFITFKPEMLNGEKYDLSNPDIPVSIQFTNLFPAEGGEEEEFMIAVTSGHLTLTHDFDKSHVAGTFAFYVEIKQLDGSILSFEVKDGELNVGPT
ncbi:hypothetical protein [Serratia quinivorans]|uniref:hypothetical protein n=1 Tax=Serratia quinivorans TaxID=137545 RepID=UPI0021B74BD2|nr:hypothetical protein [Serratia quinivorans]